MLAVENPTYHHKMSLLTPSESLAFQSFMSSHFKDPESIPEEWTMYAPPELAPDLKEFEAKEALAKATKNLMSLDETYARRNTTFADGYTQNDVLQYSSPEQVSSPESQHRPYSFSGSQSTMSPLISSPISVAPHHTLGIIRPSSGSYRGSPAAKSPSEEGSAGPSRPRTGHSGSSQKARRSSRHEPYPSGAPAKLLRVSPSATPPSITGSAKPSTSAVELSPPIEKTASTSSQTAQPGQAKPTLLSPSQKKANHIQSEQKRRANIRRGYEALCDSVPALREAIMQEEMEMEEQAANKGKGRAESLSKTAKKGKGQKVKGEDNEKLDGRAGPKSENVVLSKSIDYIEELLSHNAFLLSRLERAWDMIPPHERNHPGERLWERLWTGGTGRCDDEEEEEED